MVYITYGLVEYLIEEEIKKIIKDNNVDYYNIEKFDLENTNIKNIIDSSLTVSLFSNKKVIIVENSYIFTGTTKKNIDQNIECLEKYLDHINENTILIFKVITEKLDSRKKIVTKIKNYGKVIEFNKVSNLKDLVYKMFNPYKINHSLIEFLIDRVGNDLYILNQEIKKIKTYKDEDLFITEDDILVLTHKNINTDIFYLIDNIVSNNKEKALESYYEMLKLGEEPIKIIVMVANQFRLIYQVKELYKKGYREYDIMDILEQKQYSIRKASERINKFTSNQLLNYLNKLSELDINIKSGLIDKSIGLELFILEI